MELGRLRNDNLSQTKPRRIEGLRRNRPGVVTPACLPTPPATLLSLLTCRGGRNAVVLPPITCRDHKPQRVEIASGIGVANMQAHVSGKKTTLDHIFVGLRREKAREQLVPRPVSSVTGSESIGSLATRSMTSFDAEVMLSNDGNYSELTDSESVVTNPRLLTRQCCDVVYQP